MIDLHCHILPGVDDGPENLEESIAMAHAPLNRGSRTFCVRLITTMAVTPIRRLR